MPSSARIVKTAMQLRAVAGDEWNEFVVAMREYAAMQMTEMLQCQPELLPRAHGMALAVNEISTALVNAPKLYERMMKGNG
jgi:hypothetical protein